MEKGTGWCEERLFGCAKILEKDNPFGSQKNSREFVLLILCIRVDLNLPLLMKGDIDRSDVETIKYLLGSDQTLLKIPTLCLIGVISGDAQLQNHRAGRADARAMHLILQAQFQNEF